MKVGSKQTGFTVKGGGRSFPLLTLLFCLLFSTVVQGTGSLPAPADSATETSDSLAETPSSDRATGEAETSAELAPETGGKETEESEGESEESTDGSSSPETTESWPDETEPSEDPTEESEDPTEESEDPTEESEEKTGGFSLLSRRPPGLNVYGIIIGDYTRVRQEATTKAAIVATLFAGTRVKVLLEIDSQEDTDYPRWYAVETLDGRAGFIAVELVRLTEQSTDDEGSVPRIEDLEAHMNEQGFPESYKPALRILHAKYPNWYFTAFFPRLADGSLVSWDYALAQQSRVGVNMVPQSNSQRFKSYDSKAYDYRNDTWYHLDAGWAGASSEAVAYFLDPRNFLDEQSIFMFENLSYNPSLHTIAGVRQALAGSFMGTTTTYSGIDEAGNQVSLDHAQMFMRAAEYSQASPYFLAQRSVYEVGSQGSGSVSGTYNSSKYPNDNFHGYYNYYNIGAYSDASDPISNGLYYAKYGTNANYLLAWNSRYRAIVGGAKWIATGYIASGQHTSYLQKFDLDYDSYYGAFWHQYMGNLRAPLGESAEVYNTYANRGELQNTFEFVIPVLANMPSSAAAYPADDRSRNNYLEALTVTNGSLSPRFHPETYKYTVELADTVSETVISARAYHATATVERTGRYTVPPGGQIVTVSVTSERGDIRVYEITLKKSGSAPPTPTPSPTPSPKPSESETPPSELVLDTGNLQLSGEQLSGFDVAGGANTVASLAASLKLPAGYDWLLRSKSGESLSQGLIGTGSQLEIRQTGKTQVLKRLTVVVYGDVNGDGRVNSIDMNQIYLHRLGQLELDGSALAAADANGDGRVNSIDMNLVYKQRLGESVIPQKRER